MTRKLNSLLMLLAVVGGVATASATSFADEMNPANKAIYDDIEKTFGSVPSFVKKLPDAALAGFWQLEKDLELSDKTALTPKTKALISLAVAAQIPCNYCIFADTMTAKQFGASDAEIAEAVSMAALTRYASTTLNGLQIDFEQFKKEMGGP